MTDTTMSLPSLFAGLQPRTLYSIKDQLITYRTDLDRHADNADVRSEKQLVDNTIALMDETIESKESTIVSPGRRRRAASHDAIMHHHGRAICCTTSSALRSTRSA